jgi:gamma-glutamyltranspeptidase/glutathione hydrolase
VLRWAQIIAPAENLARFGGPVGAPAASALGPAGADAEADLRAALAPSDRRAGEARQPELAEVLGELRRNPADLHTGALAERWTAAVRAAGGQVDPEALRSFVPTLRDPIVGDVGRHRIYFPPSFATAGPYQAAFWSLITDDDSLEDARGDQRNRVIADADLRAAALYRQQPSTAIASTDWPGSRLSQAALAAPPSLDWRDGGTSFAAADGQGRAVACGVSLGRPYGFGRMAQGLGLFPAAYPPAELAPGALSPVLVVNTNTQAMFFAGSGAGAGGPMLAPLAVHRAMVEDATLLDAMAAPRLRPGRLNAVFCPGGLPSNIECETRSDAGLAAIRQGG